jgi:hypothetical protein
MTGNTTQSDGSGEDSEATDPPDVPETDAEFADEVVERIVDQHEATIGDEGVVHVGDDEDFQRFLRGMMELSQRPNDPVVRALEPTEAGELAASLWDAPGQRVVLITNDADTTHAPTYIWYDEDREEMRSAIYIPDDERQDTPCLGETGVIHNSVWGSWFERGVDDSKEIEYELLEPRSTPEIVREYMKSDCASYAPTVGVSYE